MTAAQPLLIFDSGVGGLSVLAPIRALPMPRPLCRPPTAPDFLRHPEQRRHRRAVPALLGRLRRTVRSGADRHRRNTAFDDRARRGARRARRRSSAPCRDRPPRQSRKPARSACSAPTTIVQPYVDRLASEFAADCTIVRHGSAELVELAEAKLRGEATDPLRLRPRVDGCSTGRAATRSTPWSRLHALLPGQRRNWLPLRHVPCGSSTAARHRAAGPAPARRSRMAGRGEAGHALFTGAAPVSPGLPRAWLTLASPGSIDLDRRRHRRN